MCFKQGTRQKTALVVFSRKLFESFHTIQLIEGPNVPDFMIEL